MNEKELDLRRNFVALVFEIYALIRAEELDKAWVRYNDLDRLIDWHGHKFSSEFTTEMIGIRRKIKSELMNHE